MLQNPVNAYATVQKESMSPRDLEASVLTRAAVMLKQAQDNWDSPDREAKLMDAISYNQKVWSFFQAELSAPENPLPVSIKQDILNLSLFIDKRLIEILASPDPKKLSLVISINNNLAAGLRSEATEAE
jgi:flagellar protein FlaF